MQIFLLSQQILLSMLKHQEMEILNSLAGNFGISADSFINTGEGITVNTFNLSATGNFNYAEDFVNAGNIKCC